MNHALGSRKKETRQRIVDVAARAIRSHGYAGVRAAEVMKTAGLTHGGVYTHFESHDALLMEALGCANRDIAAKAAHVAQQRTSAEISEFHCLVEVYLADQHLSSLENGCPTAARGINDARATTHRGHAVSASRVAPCCGEYGRGIARRLVATRPRVRR
ncbi:TetR/AcrR family transcriptional regulator [Ralstonia solanacearum]|uniref:Transcriptional regulator, tetr family protein n=1 Tax=Ralstonia solanacearum TaxID=305 RepID=A0AAD0SBJ4_RALSL|nr:TetR/AcrR family transcriptional regulator [Ralstonia solanacearum]AXV83967.1 transcriptional regulator, tetr family protein [Ralstonia solanacearum]AXW55096.1 transcriptional regulator, tetr family protein [Ralstonia solanacearum]